MTWRWHSKSESPEGVSPDGIDVPTASIGIVHLAPTFAVVLTLARLLRDVYPGQPFHFFLDNLFLTVPVAQALLFLDILCSGTTRKNAMGVPEELIKLKKKNQALIWNSTFSEIVDGVNCFL
jgi:hypothetical protein